MSSSPAGDRRSVADRPAGPPAGLDERIDFGCALVAEAGAIALGYFERLESLRVSPKGPQDMVSEADYAIEQMIHERISARFPDDAFVGEETGPDDSAGSDGMWVVDPIDGTQPFTCGLTTWCVSIAYIHQGVPILGFISAPARGELFVGVRDAVATLNGRPISVSEAQELDQGLTYIGHSAWLGADAVVPVFERLLRQGGQYYRDGSGALGLCYVACGRLIGYVERHMHAWDALAALAIVEAAGGTASDFLVDDALRVGGPVVAGPPSLFPALVTLLDGDR
jgi:myo-inositol-1(or 4)-monophosphatase